MLHIFFPSQQFFQIVCYNNFKFFAFQPKKEWNRILSNGTCGSSSFTARGKSKHIKSEEVEKRNFICILEKPSSLGERHNIWMTSCISRAPYLRGRESDLHGPSGNPPAAPWLWYFLAFYGRNVSLFVFMLDFRDSDLTAVFPNCKHHPIWALAASTPPFFSVFLLPSLSHKSWISTSPNYN